MASEKSEVDVQILEGKMKDMEVEDKKVVNKDDDDGVENKSEEENKKKKSSEAEEEETKEMKEVGVESVDHRSYAGDGDRVRDRGGDVEQERKEDVPTTVVHVLPKEKNLDSTSSQGILYAVGSKVMSTVSSVKEAIVGKSSSDGSK